MEIPGLKGSRSCYSVNSRKEELQVRLERWLKVAISKEEREAFENGLEIHKTIEKAPIPLISEMIQGPEDSVYHLAHSDAENTAYDKGRSGEQLDGDKGSNNEGGCFLTTACTMALDLPDDCDELTTLRRFRDNYMLTFEEGRAEVKEYYAVAPEVVKAISARPNALAIYRRIFDEIVSPCVKLIKQGRLELARTTYKKALSQFAV